MSGSEYFTCLLKYNKIGEPKILEEYEVNIIKELKVNDKLLPLSITIVYFEIQNK